MKVRIDARRKTIAVATAVTVVAGALVGTAATAAVTAAGPWQRQAGDNTQVVRDAIKDASAKNVILLVGDGMGDSEITIARNYAYGAAGILPGIDALPLTGSYTTYSVYKDGAEKGKPDYVADSAATGTAWATGSKTYDNAVSVDVDGNVLPTLLEKAKANGYNTGNVSTAEIQDATPAVQVAHVGARSCYGPDSPSCGTDALVAGGRGSISEQLLLTRPDVTLGGGLASFEQTAKAGDYSGQTLLAQAEARGYDVVTDAAGLAAVGAASQDQPVLGLFTPGNFPTRFLPSTATIGGADTPITCTENPERLEPALSLAALTDRAIGLLNDASNGDKGFFLQVEGASIDKRDHAADACGQIGETIDFDEAVQSALAFAAADGNTLVLVTADHAHSSQIVDSTPPTSLSTAVTTADGTVMKISYGTAAAGGSQQHTGSQLRIAGYGPGAANIVGLTDQTDTFFTISNVLGLSDEPPLGSSDDAGIGWPQVVRGGQPVTIAGTGWLGDRQVEVTFGSEKQTVDVVDGKISATFTAPKKTTAVKVTAVGLQSGVKRISVIAVRK